MGERYNLSTPAQRIRRSRLILRNLLRWFWYTEASCISPDESLLRGIPNDPQHYKKTMGVWCVSPYTFEPRKTDKDGISLFREDFLSAKSVSKRCRHKSGASLVAKFAAYQLTGLGLSPTEKPDPDQGPGHAVIPELRYRSSQSARLRQEQKEITVRLAEIAGRQIVHFPPGCQSQKE